MKKQTALPSFLPPILWLFIYRIRTDLPDFTSLETVRREMTTEAAPCVESDSTRAYSESICRPVTIDDELLSRIALVPRSTIYDSYHSSYLYWSIPPIVGVESSMYEDEVFSFDDRRK